jgi:hypothetical protein
LAKIEAEAKPRREAGAFPGQCRYDSELLARIMDVF